MERRVGERSRRRGKGREGEKEEEKGDEEVQRVEGKGSDLQKLIVSRGLSNAP